MSGTFAVLVARDLRLAARRRVDAPLPIAFFTVAVSLFPLGVGPEPQTLRQIAPGVVWVAALLAAMLSVTQLYAADHADGSLEQMLLVARRRGISIASPRRSRTGSSPGCRWSSRRRCSACCSTCAGGDRVARRRPRSSARPCSACSADSAPRSRSACAAAPCC